MVSSAATSVDAYLDSLSDDRREVISTVRDVVRTHLPNGYAEGMEYGMIYYAIPLDRYPETYNGHPLCYVGLAAQKNHYAIYLMGVYGDGTNAKRFKDACAKAGKKLDMGKSCVRFKSLDEIALDVIGETIGSVSVDNFIAMYEQSRLRTKAGQKKAKPSGATKAGRARATPAKKAVPKSRKT